MDPAKTSFLVWHVYNGLGDCPHNEWSRLEADDTDKLDRLLAMRPISLVPLPSDHECFRHVPVERHYRDYQAAWAAEREIDGKLYPYLDCPHLRVLAAGGGSVKGGAVVVHFLGGRDERIARIHRFEAPGATVPFTGKDGISIFHVLPPDVIGKIARHYVATCTVPDGSSIGSGLTWVPWRGASIGWGGF